MGWVSELYLRPKFLFPYEGFSWIRPWSPFLLHAHFVGLAILGVLIEQN